jgi:hypothetical protein
MHPRHTNACRVGQPPESAGRCVPIHPNPMHVTQDWPGGAVVDGSVDRTSHRWRQRDQHGRVASATDPEHTVAVFLAEVADARAASFKDPQAEETEHGDQGEVIDVWRQPGRGDQRFEL